MQTITGTLEDVSGNPLHKVVVIESLSTPQAAAGVVTAQTTLTITTDPTTGAFSVGLAPGNYLVTYQTSPRATSFSITVTGTEGTVTIDEIITSALPSLPGQIPALVWDVQNVGEGAADVPPGPPSDTSKVSFYFGPRGSFYRWSVTGQVWLPVIQ